MKNRVLLSLLALAVVVSGCGYSNTAETDTNFELLVSDRPASIDDFDRLDVALSEARIFDANDSYEAVNISGRTVDLTQVKGDKAQRMVNASLEPGNYTKIELHVSGTDGVVNGSDVEVKVPPEKLMVTRDFEIKENSTTSFVFDIQVVLRGNEQENQGYILKPVISRSGVVGEDIENVERVERQGPPE